MPFFHSRTLPSQLPPTPPEFMPGFNTANPTGISMLPPSFIPLPGLGAREKGGAEYLERFGQPATLSTQPLAYYQQSHYHPHVSHTFNQPTSRFFDHVGGQLLQSVKTESHLGDQSFGIRQQQQQEQPREQTSHQEQAVQEEKTVGGVSAKLDYDMDRMTDFVSEMAQGIIQPSTPVPAAFKKWVSQVLCATRLPSATILLSLHYLSIRMTTLSSSGRYKVAEGQIYRLLTIALLLGSKFLDDNTFINRSWSDVSGIKVSEINYLEMEWLTAIRFHLHRDPVEAQGFTTWLLHWQKYDMQAVTRSTKFNQQSTIDTSSQQVRPTHEVMKPSYQHSLQHRTQVQPMQAYTGSAQARHYEPSAFAHYDTWALSRRAANNSPPTAPTTGPPTPEYCSGHVSHPAVWNGSETYTRRTMFGFPPLTHNLPQASSFAHNGLTPTYPRQMWNAHGSSCLGMYCQTSFAAYVMAPRYAPQPVAV